MESATLTYNGKKIELPIIIGSEGEVALDISKLRKETGIITLDPGYVNTGSCRSEITFIDGEKGILRYRGYPIEELAEKCSYLEVCYLVIFGDLPTADQLKAFEERISKHTLLHEDMKKFFEGYATNAHPMTVLSTMVASLTSYYPKATVEEDMEKNMIRLLAKVKTIAAFSYKKSVGQAFIYPRNNMTYVEDFLNMMFAVKTENYKINPIIVKALNKLLILHVDHEQNCSTSTVRMCGSSESTLFHAISAGIDALSGPLHGGANQAVIEMLEMIQADNGDYQKYIDMAKDKSTGFKLMGFGHRVYKNFDPRALILKEATDEVLAALNKKDPLLAIAKKLETIALEDEYFKERKLFPNVDFYSGLIYRALEIPKEMFTVMFALGRMPGWIAHWRESRIDPAFRI
ncbi:MAG: citrate synthase, partial [Candidatus Heimdallarchaeota archaeon]|nr:citrate synthase [Candidatus Heimdallarchaeota archaeon]